MKTIFYVAICIIIATFNSYAQDDSGFFGDVQQPGSVIQKAILEKIDSGEDRSESISKVINESLGQNATALEASAKAVLAFDLLVANSFFEEMISSNSLIEVTKILSETFPEKAIHIVTLGVTLYPDFAQEVYDGALLSGVLTADDALIAAVQAGADPTAISNPTASGPVPTIGVIPLGAGIGAGGTGGGDTTASTN